jgi:hypothetical protein
MPDDERLVDPDEGRCDDAVGGVVPGAGRPAAVVDALRAVPPAALAVDRAGVLAVGVALVLRGAALEGRALVVVRGLVVARVTLLDGRVAAGVLASTDSLSNSKNPIPVPSAFRSDEAGSVGGTMDADRDHRLCVTVRTAVESSYGRASCKRAVLFQ